MADAREINPDVDGERALDHWNTSRPNIPSRKKYIYFKVFYSTSLKTKESVHCHLFLFIAVDTVPYKCLRHQVVVT